MPKRTITIPSDIHFRNPETNEPLPTEHDPMAILSFRRFIVLLFRNPLWNEGYKQALAQNSIQKALDEALEKKEPSFVIADSDWEFLATTIRKPRIAVPVQDGSVPGFGLAPSIIGQLVPFLNAVMEAPSDAS